MRFSQLAFAALAAMSMIGAAAGADDNTRSPRASVIIPSDASMVDGVPATVSATAPRKLMKNSKASNANALSQNEHNFLRNIVFKEAMELYRFLQPSLDDTALGGVESSRIFCGARLISKTMKIMDEAECELCLSFLWDVQYSTGNEQYVYCENVVSSITDNANPPYTDDHTESMLNSCVELSQCPSQNTGLACCQSHGACGKITQPDCSAEQNDLNYCKLNEDSGSTENYLIQTETKEGCDTESTAIGCGTCKDKGTSDTILEQAGMPTNDFSFVSYCRGGPCVWTKQKTKCMGLTKYPALTTPEACKDLPTNDFSFVSYCRGGPCVWTTQKTQCMGLTKYPALTTPEACKDACCGDYTCAVWQFDADGYSNQCWYGKNCDKKGGLTWTYGGIREMGTDQAPDCALNYCKLSCDSGSCENYWIQTETKAECDTESTALGCGACKDKDTSDAILRQAHMPRDGFVSLCEGGPCVWTEQKTQCMGLTSYSTLTTWEACKNACCDDKNCAVWQFSAEGYVNQCWYGANCDTKGGLTWKYGGIRKTPDCVDPRLC